MAGGADSRMTRARTPRSELARLRASSEGADSAARRKLMESMLEVSGARGYRATSVQDVLDHAGSSRVRFYSHFASKADCFAMAYEVGIEDLYTHLLDAGRAAETWRGGLRAALCELAKILADRPATMRALASEVHVAGGDSLAKRSEMLERLSRAVDSARREAGPRSEPPPRTTALFMVGAVESALTGALAHNRPEEFTEAVPPLTHLIVAAYFGEKAAEEDRAALQAA